MPDVVIAGAGRSGLLTARALAEQALHVTIVERLPAPGGQEPDPEAAALARSAERAGAQWRFGTIALRRRRETLATLGVDGSHTLQARVLVLATGTRPSTRAELHIVGDRGAGVLPGSVAHHYLDAGVLPGWNPLVVGSGQLAHELCEQLARGGAKRITRVMPGSALGSGEDVVFDNARVVAVHGFPRVTSATVRQGDRITRVVTDAVLLAEGRVPMRNIEGALVAGDGIVECFSSHDPKTQADAAATAEAACQQVLAALDAKPAHTRRSTS
jgi:thioredoxin reductase